MKLKKRYRIGRERTILLICMGISLLFWIFVKLSKTYQTNRTIKLQYQLPPGKDFAEPPPATLRATISDPGWDLMYRYIFRPSPAIVFNLSNYPSLRIEREELMARIESLVSANVTDISRDYLSLLLDTTATRKVPVVLDSELAFAPDFALRDSITLMPDSIVIWGSATAVGKVSSIETQRLEVTGLHADFRKTVALKKPENLQINLSPESVEVFFPVEQFTEKQFEVPIQVATVKDSIRIVPAKVTLTCTVGLSHYEETTADDFIVEADLNVNVTNSAQNTVPLTLAKKPAGVKNVFISPSAVEFYIIQ